MNRGRLGTIERQESYRNVPFAQVKIRDSAERPRESQHEPDLDYTV
jgi:hypothetical protein